MSDRDTRTRASYSTRVRRPSSQGPLGAHGLLALVLVLIFPPIGLIYMWREGIFERRGRALLTAVSVVEMGAFLVLLTPRPDRVTALPAPTTPVAVTQAPANENLDALYNIEALLYQQQLADVAAQANDEADSETDALAEQQADEANEAVLDTVVYSVYRNAKYYHVNKECEGQTNGRELTVREAMRESLAPCPNCNPPTPTA